MIQEHRIGLVKPPGLTAFPTRSNSLGGSFASLILWDFGGFRDQVDHSNDLDSFLPVGGRALASGL